MLKGNQVDLDKSSTPSHAAHPGPSSHPHRAAAPTSDPAAKEVAETQGPRPGPLSDTGSHQDRAPARPESDA